MTNSRFGRIAALVALLATMLPALGAAQSAEDVISLAASGLNNPRGFTWDDEDRLYVAVAGRGGTDSMISDTQEPVMAGTTAGVMVIDDGCPVRFAHGLPSTRGMSGHEQGPGAAAFLDGTLYVLQDSAGSKDFIRAGFPNGVFAVEKGGDVRLVADISSWMIDNPVAHIPYDLTDLGEPFAMLAGKGELWVLEANSGQVLTVTPDGTITRVVDLSLNHPVPTGFALAPDGGVYVAFLTPAPYTDGTSRVVKVTASGDVTEVWTGLTMVTGLAVGHDGTLYAIEMSTGNTDEPPFTQAGSGRVVRQAGPDSLTEVVTGIDYPIAVAIGPDGALYVGFPAFGGDEVTGGIIRIDVAAVDEAVALPAGILDESRCATAVEAAPASAPVTPAAATPPPAITAEATPDLSEKTRTGAVAIDIKDFAFHPAEVRIPAGTVITWTNSDVVAHTATAPDGAFNSGNLNPGESFSFTFDTAGTFDYICTYHPFMKGTIVVE
ncbi:MAG: ScyD/ScyE family protein [Chloroflexota bacterium]|nr:ScyD/ScyE family protein [Chloroflexota bacterium]